MIPYPQIDPVAIEIFNLPIRWYGLAYVAGFLLGVQYLKHTITRGISKLTLEQLDALFIYVIVGVIAGGRLGYALLYHPSYYLMNPLEIVKTWEGGMSFHGGLIGVSLAILLFAYRHKLHPSHISDFLAPAIPIGLFFGRIANFINAELWGRPTTAPWAMIFPTDPLGLTRHPSQLYQAMGEGLLLFILLHLALTRLPYKRWRVTGLFLVGYATVRFLAEFVRTPDAGFDTGIYAYLTQGQLLTIPMAVLGVYFLTRRSA